MRGRGGMEDLSEVGVSTFKGDSSLSPPPLSLSLSLDIYLSLSTELWIFVGKEVRETRRRERGNSGSGTTKKREISRTSLPINLHF